SAVVDDTLTIEPPLGMCLDASRAHMNVPRTLTAIIRSHSLIEISWNGRRPTSIAALLTRPSMSPASLNKAITSCSSLTSQTMSQPGKMSVETTSAPRSRSSPTRRAPMPRAPPVTTIRLSLTLIGQDSRRRALQDGDDAAGAIDLDEIAGLDAHCRNRGADYAGDAVF